MAKLQEEIIAIKLSKIARDSDEAFDQIISDETSTEIEMLVQQLINDATVVVEVIRP